VPREPARFVFVEQVACPRCGSVDIKTTRSIANGDGSRSRSTACRACDWKFTVVVERPSAPEFGLRGDRVA